MLDEIKSDLSELVTSIYGRYVKYGFITGSALYVPFEHIVGSSDIDFLVVLDDSAVNDSTKDMRLEFNEGYFALHDKYSLSPDDVFPGEIISESMLDKVKNGAGFVVNNGQLSYSPISGDNSSWLTSPELEYRCWRSMFFYTSPENVFTGSLDSFSSDRKDVVLPLLLFINQFSDADHIGGYELDLIKNISSSNPMDFGHLPKYDSSLFNGGKINGIDVPEILSSYGLISPDGLINKVKLNDFILNLKNSSVQANDSVGTNPFLILEGVDLNKF